MLSRADANNIVLAATNMDVSEFLNELIEEGAESFPNIKFSSVIPPNVHWQCDEALMAQLIHNLYANAIKYNKPNGWVHLALHQTNKVIEIKVSNSANHIPHDLNERAFERFYRGNYAHSRQADGQGLGLSIALEIAKVHQGKLSIQAQDGAVAVTFEAPVSQLL
jgi:signal transduction histidine kinase